MLHDIMSRCDYLDMMELLANRRAACRVSIRDGFILNMLDYIDEWNLEFSIMSSPPFVTNIYGATSDLDRHEDQYEVYLSKDVNILSMTISAELNHDYRYLGELYRYPSCCVEAFCNSMTGDMQPHVSYPHLTNAIKNVRQDSIYKKIMTPDLSNRVLSFFPCSFDCNRSLQIATWRVDFMKRHHEWKPLATMFGGIDFAS